MDEAPGCWCTFAMELLPILEPLSKPKEGIWYSVMPTGGGPGVTVGHTCTYLPSAEDGCKGKILIVGGADPNGSFSASHVINLDRHEWDLPEWEGLEARYEHCTFVPETPPQSVWVFAGAQPNSNCNSVQRLQLTGSGDRWRTVRVAGQPPSPRTYHTSSAGIRDKLYVFSGGDAGATPISDPKLHVFDTVSSSWSQPATGGKQPTARHGQVIIAVGSRLYIHGGMAGDKFYTVALGNTIYIFGGMTQEGASNSMYKFNTDRRRWVLMKFEGDLPANRLDHSMCVVPWTSEDVDSGESETKHLAFIFGGMDTQGVIHSDCVVTILTSDSWCDSIHSIFSSTAFSMISLSSSDSLPPSFSLSPIWFFRE
ncbi:hypothetical protein CRUP_003723 [Coryphaenoides rupestris]|nr:hypothetical protein CRUP_003723 [Coryphaenoides rupestris]